MIRERADKAARCEGSRGLYVFLPCRAMTRTRINGRPYCRHHEQTAVYRADRADTEQRRSR